MSNLVKLKSWMLYKPTQVQSILGITLLMRHHTVLGGSQIEHLYTILVQSARRLIHWTHHTSRRAYGQVSPRTTGLKAASHCWRVRHVGACRHCGYGLLWQEGHRHGHILQDSRQTS